MSNASAHGPLGVLLVHGIGEQQVGDTLLGFTEPLQAFCREWVDGAPTPEEKDAGATSYADAFETRLRRLTGDDDAPSHTRLRIGLERPGPANAPGDGRTEWLIAESHWAERFPVPTFGQIFAWLFSVVAPVVVRHVDFRLLLPTTVKNFDRIGRLIAAQKLAHEAGAMSEASAARLAVKAYTFVRKGALAVFARLQNIVSIALAAVIMAFLVALLPLGVFPRTRRFVLNIQSKVANSLGDSYVLLRSPLRADAMVAQIERDIEWLEDQGRTRIAVVAHSQGAEVARRALVRRRGGKANVELFVTFGAAIEKLDAVDQLARHPFKTWGHFILRAIGAAALVALPFAVGSVQAWDTEPTTALIVALVLVAWYAPRFAKTIRENLVTPLTDENTGGKALEEHGTRWLDLWASSDPVSEGSLDLDGQRSRSIRITNYRSTLRDHTSYWQNVEEFTTRVAFELGKLSNWRGFDALRETDRSRARRAIAERHRRTKWLLLGRWSAGLTGVLVVALARNPLTVPDSIATYADDVPGLSDDLAANIERHLHEATMRGWLGVTLAVLALAAFHWVVTVRAWNWWDRAAGRSLVSREDASKWPQILTYAVIAVPPVAAAVLLVVLAGAAADAPQLALGILALIAVAAAGSQVIRRRWATPVPKTTEERFREVGTDVRVTGTAGLVGPRHDSDRAAPVVAHGCLWVSSGSERGVFRIPLDEAVQTPPIPVGGNTLAMAADDSAVWVSTDEGEIVRLPADGGAPTKRISLSAPSPALASGNGHLWAIDTETARVLGISKDGGNVSVRSRRLGTPTALAVDDTRIWVADQALHGVFSLDLEDLRGLGRKIEIGLTPAAMQCDETGVWLWFRPGLVGLLPRNAGTDDQCDAEPHKLGSVFKAYARSPRRRGHEWLVPANGSTWVLRGRDGRRFDVEMEKETLALTETDVRLPAPVTGVALDGRLDEQRRIYVTMR